MKHNLKITIILLGMFLITQFIGLAVIKSNPLKIDAVVNGTVQEIENPYLTWIAPPEAETKGQYAGLFSQILIAFVIAIMLLLFLMKFKVEVLLKVWFFTVVSVALFISLLAFEKIIPIMIELKTALLIAAVLAIPLAYIKIYKRSFLIHNLTEFFIYPGIALIFVELFYYEKNPLLSIGAISLLLILISIYDVWAVWHSGIMQKMAKYQIQKLNIFSGFFVPYVSKKLRIKLKKMKKSRLKGKRIKVNVAILGGGDIIFPIITAGLMMKTLGFVSALFVIAGATLGLAYLFFFSEKRKFYPAMPFITAGIFAGIVLSWLIL